MVGIIIKELSLRNFLSYGNTFETVSFNNDPLTLIMGINYDKDDTGGERNGTGKSTIGVALLYGLYGLSIGKKIKVTNLVNKINKSNMEVKILFEKNGINYRIERGRNPEYLKFYINDGMVDVNEAQGENSKTQIEINKILGMSREMFEQLVLITTQTSTFLELPSAKQRLIIEELLGVTQLSAKADVLKELIKETKKHIEQEEFKINAIKQTNINVLANYERQKNQIYQNMINWDNNRDKTLNDLIQSKQLLSTINIDEEILNHQENDKLNQQRIIINQLNNELRQLMFHVDTTNKRKQSITSKLSNIEAQLISLGNNVCPTCGQTLDNIDDITNKITQSLSEISLEEQECDDLLVKYNKTIEDIKQNLISIPDNKQTFYKTITEAYEHKSNIDILDNQYNQKQNEENPFKSQYENIGDAPLQEISYDSLNAYSTMKEHQEFLLKLLTAKDSYVRKRIIEHNISYLNSRLTVYLNQLGMIHNVKFNSDLTVEIERYGQLYDFGNLSRGEKTRVILSLSFSFRDLWEALYGNINLYFIDELIDNGLDPSGIENVVTILKNFCYEHNKNVFVVSHREELISRVSNNILVVMSDGFSSLSKI